MPGNFFPKMLNLGLAVSSFCENLGQKQKYVEMKLMLVLRAVG